MHTLSCTYLGPNDRSVKDEFYTNLDAALSGVPQSEIYVLLWDINACVGSREMVDDQWDGVRGPHGHGVMNEERKRTDGFFYQVTKPHSATHCS